MKSIYKILILGAVLMPFTACDDDEFLEKDPPTVIQEEQVWNDPKMITSLLANYYDRLPTYNSTSSNWQAFAAYDEAMWSGNGEGQNNIQAYSPFTWTIWNYGLIRDINLALENIDQYSATLPDEQKTQFKAELRFLRAFVYFSHVRSMGGVPLVTQQLIYDFSGDPSSLQLPRNKEHEVYDFVASELDAIKEDLGNEGSIRRANKFTALALKSRAMLYAASIAKYNNESGAPIAATPGGEAGIPASMASDYYTKSLEASKEIINSGVYSLYKGNSAHLGENFAEAISKKQANPEVILAQDFSTASDKRIWFTYDNIARGIREDNLSSSNITPVLNLVEDFEYLDGSSGELRTRTADDSDYIYYDELDDIFENKDARLYGTVIYPGASFKGQEVEMQAGVKVWNGSGYETVEGNQLGSDYTDGETLVGSSGPHRSITEVSNSGFYMRKYVDPTPMSSTRGVRSEMWWIRFRYAEILLNAAEAALELGQMQEAVGYVNTVRERAGFGENSLTELTVERLRNERRVELAFEDHRIWDVKRWRIAHEIWNGSPNNPDAVLQALYPYRIIRPDHPTHNKYVFEKLVAPRFGAPRNFQVPAYYAALPQDVLNNNPKLVRNPFH
ncbi:RagB/SusD family nutrient uptake outer membrane protein [Pontibacter diazotrophicus]|uniref:RagB/SusD family nutrient uptake outer membrane protein n=1 Tax=Pontibacter diazotrophicus TaxID=1400979 RepID=A0A3D8L247_9BACT|nr:RagB/SusD family nutrient uptake outer membrane protein [Pontibacter diazotrophicus]RDV11519.1 RagB/SusD family nutrient uptake outer membrane protein [Pontibacter diazotrophicus]